MMCTFISCCHSLFVVLAVMCDVNCNSLHFFIVVVLIDGAVVSLLPSSWLLLAELWW